jgi:hypothetical protein
MIGREHYAHRLNDADIERSLNCTQLRGERFELTQRTAGLRQHIEAAIRRGANRLIYRRDRSGGSGIMSLCGRAIL